MNYIFRNRGGNTQYDDKLKNWEKTREGGSGEFFRDRIVSDRDVCHNIS